MLGQVLCMFFGLPLYSDSSFTIWALSMYQWPMTIPKLTLKGSVLFLVSSCYFCCKIWKLVYLMINDLCLVYYIFIQDCFILPCTLSLPYMICVLRYCIIIGGCRLVLRTSMFTRVTPIGENSLGIPL